PLERLTSYSEATRLSGYEPGSELVTVEQVPASGRVAQALEVEPGAPLLRLLRLRTADGEPLQRQDAYLPPRFLELSIVELSQSGSLYRTLDTLFGVRPLRGRQWVGARQPTSLELRHLRLSRDVPVLSKERITYGLDERPIEYVLAVARGDKYPLVVHMAEEQAGCRACTKRARLPRAAPRRAVAVVPASARRLRRGPHGLDGGLELHAQPLEARAGHPVGV